VKVGITLPQFRHDAEAALAAAREAESAGIDGVFVFDHLWPIGQPNRPIVSSLALLGALAVETSELSIASLVMRVGVFRDEALVAELLRVQEISGGRLLAGLGTGDRLSEDENRAYGIPYGSVHERRAELRRVALALRAGGCPVWIGAGTTVSPGTREVARDVGAALNVWDTGVMSVAAEREVEVTWGGPVPGGAHAVAERLRELSEAGATWAVCAWPESLDAVAEARRLLNSG